MDIIQSALTIPSRAVATKYPIIEIKNHTVHGVTILSLRLCDLLSRRLVEHSTATTSLSPTGVSFISSPLPWPSQPLDSVGHLSVD
jgi:hypothetical protein